MTTPGTDGVPQHAAPEDAVLPEGADELSPGDGSLVVEPINDLSDTALTGETISPRPEPVLSAARVAGVISGVILSIGGALKLVGWLVPADYDLQALADQVGNGILAVGAAWSLIGPWLTARIRARDKVTPLADPRDNLGRKLIPEER